MSEEFLVRNCAPTLAGLKTANLFSCPCAGREELARSVRQLNGRLNGKGLRIVPLRFSQGRALIYLYRPGRLQADMADAQAARMLRELGYDPENSNRCLVRLSQRLRQSEEFPHEIGLFLGYPLGDVIGFIENHGQNCLCSGVWKVYTNPEAAAGAFRKFSKCTRVYRRLFFGGQRNVEQLTVKSA